MRGRQLIGKRERHGFAVVQRVGNGDKGIKTVGEVSLRGIEPIRKIGEGVVRFGQMTVVAAFHAGEHAEEADGQQSEGDG